MGKIEQLPSGTYRTRITWTENGHRRSMSLSHKSKRMLQKMMLEFTPPKEEKVKSITLEQAFEDYIHSRDRVLSPSTIRAYRSCVRQHYWTLKNKDIYKLTQNEIQNYFNQEKLEPKTLRNLSGLLTATLKEFRPDFQFSVRLPQKRKEKISIPTQEEMEKIIKASADYDIQLPVMLACYQGLRMSEITGLRWRNIDTLDHTIRIDTARVITEGGRYVLKHPKTTAGERTLQMVPALYGILEDGERWANEEDFVTDLNNSQISERYRKMMRRIGLSYTFHQLRHYACSVMIAAGIPTKYIADFLGHASENMVNTVYGHVMEDKKEEFFKKYTDYLDKGKKV